MKKILFVVASLFASSLMAQPVNHTFVAGEELTFRLYYDAWLADVTAGYGTVTVQKKPEIQGGRPVYHIVGEGKSKGMFNLFFKVKDRFETWVDTASLLPCKFTRSTREGGYRKDDVVIFDQRAGTATSSTKKKKIRPGTHDIISAVFFARNLDISHVREGDILPVPFFLDDSVYTSAVKYLGRDTITIESGRFSCLKFKPMVATGAVFSDPYPMVLYVSDDRNHVPLLAESAIVVGKVKMELTNFKGLRYPMTSKIRKKK
ncbi:MAG: DUF3108 domain-containing protein [Bacteroidetes bacterium HGW-Bacteroidetes-22]|nr:MAG: DUF3108 domain-containing protein [Bacteroidetes bacterium HGW-Bacteroidetes-22]